MTLSNHIAAYGDCINFFEAALADRAGARTKFLGCSEAHHFAMRMYQARALLRAETRLQYPDNDPRYNKSEFDCLMIRVKLIEDTYWVYAERPNIDLEIEPLTPPPNPSEA